VETLVNPVLQLQRTAVKTVVQAVAVPITTLEHTTVVQELRVKVLEEVKGVHSLESTDLAEAEAQALKVALEAPLLLEQVELGFKVLLLEQQLTTLVAEEADHGLVELSLLEDLVVAVEELVKST
jgi:hypothetical protein